MKWALIIGASSGIGAASAIRLARDGFEIVGVHFDRRVADERVQSVRAAIGDAGRKALFFNQSVTDHAARHRLIQELSTILEPEGKIFAVVHSVAFGVLRPLVGEQAATDEDITLTSSAMGHDIVFWVRDLVAKNLLASPGRIIAMTSEGDRRACRNYGPVAAAKCALEAHIRQLAVELGHLAVTSNCILAGVTDTPALRRIPDCQQLLERAQARNPRGRLTRPEDVAALVSLLCEERAGWVSGAILPCDGGESIAV